MVYSLVVHLSIGIAVAVLSLAFDSFFTYELGMYLLFAIAAQGVGFCWGRAGIIPLGNAVFFGFTAYLSGYVLKTFSGGILFLLIPLTALLPSIFAFCFAYVLLLRTGNNSLFFSLITLALAMLAALIATSWSSVTGGYDGMLGIPSIGNLDNIEELYWLILPVSVIVSFMLFYLTRSPYGTLLKACLDNEFRLRFFGFSTAALKASAFAISALCASIAGALYAPHQGIVTPQVIGFILSTELVIWSALGGRFSIYGPLIGTLAIGFLTVEIRDSISYWEAIVAILFILVVLYSPNGMVEIMTRMWQKIIAKIKLPFHHLPQILRPVVTHSSVEVGVEKEPFNRLEINDVSFTASGSRILSNLNLTLDKPVVYALIGPNGAGKTSVFNAITNNISYQKGNISLGQIILNQKSSEAIIHHNLSRKFQIPSVFHSLTVRQNLLIAIWCKRMNSIEGLTLTPLKWHSKLTHEVLQHFEFLQDKYEHKAGNLSQGEKQMLEFAMVVCSEPNLMLLDEPCAGLSPQETEYMIESIKFFAEKLNSCVLIIEHDMNAVKKIADKVLVLNKGSLLFSGTMADVQSNAEVKSIYSGGHK